MKALLVLTFLFLKTGEKFATQEAAGPTVSAFTAAVAQPMGGGVAFEPRVFNDPARAAEYCGVKKPAVGIVTPGFYFERAGSLGMEPLLETRRQGVAEERYVVVARKTAGDGLEMFKGKPIWTTLATEPQYVAAVILQGKASGALLKPVSDVESAAFDVADTVSRAGDGVLMEEGTWKVLAQDQELGPKLKVVYRSDVMPCQLVVAFRANAGGLDLDKLKTAMKGLNAEVLGSIRVEKFADVDQDRLKKAGALFHGK